MNITTTIQALFKWVGEGGGGDWQWFEKESLRNAGMTACGGEQVLSRALYSWPRAFLLTPT